jgi:hypothetical protein
MRACIILLLLSVLSSRGNTQVSWGDSVAPASRRNVLRFNPTPMILCGNLKNITFSYERLLKPNQSLVLQAGFLEIPPVFNDSAGGFADVERVSDFGLNIALDYRFYPLRRNQYPSPDGLYLGPYFSYYGFTYHDKITYMYLDTTRVENVRSSYNFFNLGVMLGYQFIFWKRLSVDLLIFGPSFTYAVSSYKGEGAFSAEDEQEYLDAMKDQFREKFPLLAPFVDPNSGHSTASFRMFFRYSISVGIAF